MARFLNGLNRDIQDIMELHDYTSISMLVHQASKVESQLKRHGKNPTLPLAQTGRCPNKRAMILIDDGDIESESSQEDIFENDGYSGDETPYEGDLLMVRRLISAFIKDDQTQRESIFHSRCMVKGNCCFVNVASLRLVEKLCLPIIPYPKPYKLQWLNSKGEMLVDQQVPIELTLGFVIGFERVKVIAKKVKATSSWSTPRSVRHIKSFHGITRFHKHFVKNFSILVVTLNKILKIIRLHKPIVLRGTPSFSVTVGEPCGVSLTLSYSFLLLVIPRWMDRLRSPLY
ncbi:hypothetical protein CR513_57125, partial [Mucuna pruriens]